LLVKFDAATNTICCVPETLAWFTIASHRYVLCSFEGGATAIVNNPTPPDTVEYRIAFPSTALFFFVPVVVLFSCVGAGAVQKWDHAVIGSA
jgi:hypothetical protein